MVDVEELMSKIRSGVWSTQDAFDCIKDLEQEYLQGSKTKELRKDYSFAVYFTSYGIFACSYRECVFPMIELCQKLLENCPNSADQALYYTMIREADHRMYQCKTKNHSRLQKKENII